MSDYAKLKVAELQAQLKERSLPHIGKKDELIARLQQHDASKIASAPAAAAQEDEIDWDDDTSAQPAPVAVETAETTSATERVAEPMVEEMAANGATNGQADPGTAESVIQDASTTAASREIESTTTQSAPTAPPLPTDQEISDELAKRLARIDKYVNKSDPTDVARAEEEKAKLLRLAKFKDQDTSSANDIHNPKGMLDAVLPERRERKRGRGEGEGSGERGGKRRRGGGGGGDRRNGGGEQRRANGGGGGGQSNWMSEKDRDAAKRRAERFATQSAA